MHTHTHEDCETDYFIQPELTSFTLTYPYILMLCYIHLALSFETFFHTVSINELVWWLARKKFFLLLLTRLNACMQTLMMKQILITCCLVNAYMCVCFFSLLLYNNTTTFFSPWELSGASVPYRFICVITHKISATALQHYYGLGVHLHYLSLKKIKLRIRNSNRERGSNQDYYQHLEKISFLYTKKIYWGKDPMCWAENDDAGPTCLFSQRRDIMCVHSLSWKSHSIQPSSSTTKT